MVRPPIHRRRRTSRTSAPTDENVDPTPLDHPVFAQPQPTADPTQFRLRHPSDADAYKTIDELNAEHKLGPMPFPAPRGGTEPILTLAQVLGPSGDEAVKRIAASGQLVFHAVGDTGSTRGPHNQSLVADKMIADFDEGLPRTCLSSFSIWATSSTILVRYSIIMISSTSLTAIILRRYLPSLAIMMGWSLPAQMFRRLPPSSTISARPTSWSRRRPAACRARRKSSPACSSLSRRRCCASSPFIPTCWKTPVLSLRRKSATRNWIS